MMVSWELGCRSLQDFWFFRETSFAKQEEALKFNFSVSHCLLSNILWFVALCMRQHATKRKNKDFYFLEQNRVFFMPKAREHGFCFSSLLYAEQTELCDHTWPSSLKIFCGLSLWPRMLQQVQVLGSCPKLFDSSLRSQQTQWQLHEIQMLIDSLSPLTSPNHGKDISEVVLSPQTGGFTQFPLNKRCKVEKT